MILMALDHSSAMIARQHSSEFWAGAMTAYTSAFPFLTRWITHLCAPGFFFLMGAGIYWSSSGRSADGNIGPAAVRRTIMRGLAIFLVGQSIELPSMFLMSLLPPAAASLGITNAPPPNDGTQPYWALITLSGLGLVMIACGLLLRMRPWVWLAVSVLCVIATHSLLPADGTPGSLLMTIMLAPGMAQHVVVIYPVIPWLAAGAAGLCFGYWWRRNPAQAARGVWYAGAVLLMAGIAVRAAGGWGNIRLPRDPSWIEFLNNVKYPPSFVFLAISLGVGLLVIGLLGLAPASWKDSRSPLIVFGQTPLFFYVAHFCLFIAFAFAFFREAGTLKTAYAMWVVVVVLLYPPCEWYRRFKLNKPRESLWRML